VRMYSYCGQIKREWSSISEGIHGTKGYSECVNGRNFIKGKDGSSWRADAKSIDPYVQEHIDLINAILKDTELNETKSVTDSTLTTIMGREAAYSGAAVDWETMLNSKFAYGPELLYGDAFKMQWGAFRTLKPPMPSQHDIFKNPPLVPVVGA
jgi:myo-inositol 2-dehydrogenase / D-chiro-inositol 1-dehydrogenase